MLLILLLALLGVTCSPPPGVETPPPSEIERQMDLADSFAQGNDFRWAIHLYSIIADKAPETVWGATAAPRTALLLSAPGILTE